MKKTKIKTIFVFFFLFSFSTLSLAETNEEIQRYLEQANLNYSEGNNEETFAWFSKAAECNNAEGLYCLGLCYETGIGVSIDYNKALENYEKSLTEWKKRDNINNTDVANIYIIDKELFFTVYVNTTKHLNIILKH